MAWVWLGAIGALALAVVLDRRRRRYADLPTTPAAAVFAGRNEVKGQAWAAEPLTSHRARVPCVWWSYTLEEERRHTRTVTSTDSKGHTTTRTETYTQWHEIDRLSDALSEIEVVDRTGSAVVRLDGARVVPRHVHSDTFRKDRDGGFLSGLFDNRTGRYRETEQGVAVGDSLFVVGVAHLDERRLVPVLASGVMVSTRSEESHRGWLGFGAALAFLLAAAGTIVAAALTISPSEPTRPVAWAPGVALVVAGLFVGWGVTTYNRLRLVAQGVDRAWSLLDVQLRRRHDLIPALVEVVRAHAAYESDALAGIASRHAAPEGGDDNQELEDEAVAQTVALRQLVALAERYPELTADTAFEQLRAQLADTEDRIAASRTFYNDSLTMLHDRCARFPDSLVARRVPLQHRELLHAESFERTVPPVERAARVG